MEQQSLIKVEQEHIDKLRAFVQAACGFASEVRSFFVDAHSNDPQRLLGALGFANELGLQRFNLHLSRWPREAYDWWILNDGRGNLLTGWNEGTDEVQALLKAIVTIGGVRYFDSRAHELPYRFLSERYIPTDPENFTIRAMATLKRYDYKGRTYVCDGANPPRLIKPEGIRLSIVDPLPSYKSKAVVIEMPLQDFGAIITVNKAAFLTRNGGTDGHVLLAELHNSLFSQYYRLVPTYVVMREGGKVGVERSWLGVDGLPDDTLYHARIAEGSIDDAYRVAWSILRELEIQVLLGVSLPVPDAVAWKAVHDALTPYLFNLPEEKGNAQ